MERVRDNRPGFKNRKNVPAYLELHLTVFGKIIE